jgi:cytosine/adenosine deaminase-related metal-dependent hydrolase
VSDGPDRLADRGGGDQGVGPAAAMLIRSCDVVVTMDDAGSELPGASILVEDGRVAWVGRGEPPGTAATSARVMDGRGTVAVPGLINTHHHLYQSMTRVRALGRGLFDWLVELYPVWAGLDEEWVRVATMVGLAELALSGCSTSTDHHYIFPPGSGPLLEAEIDAAAQVGLRFHPCRGSMDLGRSAGGLPPDEVVESTDDALAATEEAIARHHDPSPGSMLRIAVGPCSPFSASPRLIRESAALARARGVRLHTHIAETTDEERYCLETAGVRPVELLDDLGYLASDVWLAHCVHLSDGDIAKLATTGTAVAHCPSSNLRIGSGIARAHDLLKAGVAVGLGVDGSASNDAGDLLEEARQAMLVARAHGAPDAISDRDALRAATRGGAACLGRDDIGSIVPGKRADVALFDVEGLSFAGAAADPVAALLHCRPGRVRSLLVEGRPVVTDGRLATADEDTIAAEGHRVARRVAAVGAPAR